MRWRYFHDTPLGLDELQSNGVTVDLDIRAANRVASDELGRQNLTRDVIAVLIESCHDLAVGCLPGQMDPI